MRSVWWYMGVGTKTSWYIEFTLLQCPMVLESLQFRNFAEKWFYYYAHAVGAIVGSVLR